MKKITLSLFLCSFTLLSCKPLKYINSTDVITPVLAKGAIIRQEAGFETDEIDEWINNEEGHLGTVEQYTGGIDAEAVKE